MSNSRSTAQKWVVLLEIAADEGSGPITPAAFGRLIDSWAESAPTTLYSTSRYALQVSVEAPSPALALSSTLWGWRDALLRTGLPEWELVRAELVTPDELEREIQVAERQTDECGSDRSAAARPNAMEDELLRRAFHDGRTGLPNREMFLDDVRQTLATRGTRPPLHAVVVLGLDRLQSVGNPSSRATGDAVIVEAARRLAGTVRRTDLVANVGEDDLAVLLELKSPEVLDGVAERILDRLCAPVLVAGRPVAIRVSAGTVRAKPEMDADILLITAEKAMHAARDGARNAGRYEAAPARATSRDE